jgi:hypothetical protein
VPPCSAPVVAGTIISDPIHVCAAGGTTQLDLLGSTLATGLTYEWLSSTSAAGPFVTTGGTTLPYNTDPIMMNTSNVQIEVYPKFQNKSLEELLEKERTKAVKEQEEYLKTKYKSLR